MDTNNIYKDPIMKRYADLITGATKHFKSVYYGDPIRIPNSSLPALIIAKSNTKVGNMTNVEDQHAVKLSFTVVTDIRDTITDDKTMVPGVNALYNIMEGRNPVTTDPTQPASYSLKADSLLYILRHNVELDTANNLRTDLSTMSMVDYGLTMGKRKQDAWAIEGMIDIIVNFSQIR